MVHSKGYLGRVDGGQVVWGSFPGPTTGGWPREALLLATGPPVTRGNFLILPLTHPLPRPPTHPLTRPLAWRTRGRVCPAA